MANANGSLPDGISAAFMDAAEEYPKLSSYQQLDPARKEIRILSFGHTAAKIDKSTRLKLSIQTHSMTSVSVQYYHALSYCWGDPTLTQLVDVGGDTVKIRTGVVDFLRYLQNRYHRQRFHFWLDILCINQTDIAERNHQVSIMDQIYSQALGVYAYVAPETADTLRLTDYISSKREGSIKFNENKVNMFEYPTDLQYGVPGWLEGLEYMSTRDYFSRLWIIQEAVFAKKLTLVVGERSLEWADFMAAQRAAPTATARLSANSDIRNRLLAIDHLRSEFANPNVFKERLMFLLALFIECGCRDPKDAVYALLPMSSDRVHFQIEYRELSLAVWWQVFRLCFDPSRTTVGIYNQEADLALMGKLYRKMVKTPRQVDELSKLSPAAQKATGQLAIYSFTAVSRANLKCLTEMCCRKNAHQSPFSDACTCWTADRFGNPRPWMGWRTYDVVVHDTVTFPWTKDVAATPATQPTQLVANCSIMPHALLLSLHPTSRMLFVAEPSPRGVFGIVGQAWVTDSLEVEAHTITWKTRFSRPVLFAHCSLPDFDWEAVKKLRQLRDDRQTVQLGLQQKHLWVNAAAAIAVSNQQADMDRQVGKTAAGLQSVLEKVFVDKQWNPTM